MTNLLMCLVCDKPFIYGQIRPGYSQYNGRPVRDWGGYICRDCEGQNWDGIVAGHHPGFLDRIKANSGHVEYTKDGYIKIPPRGG